MKKSLFAIAAVTAFAGAAQAQSSVTVYGIIDMGFTSASTRGNSLTDPSQKTTNAGFNAGGNGAQTSSRLGFRGNEDLGGGTSAFFTIETEVAGQTVDVVNGNRQTFVGLGQKGIGRGAIGTQYTVMHDSVAATDPGQSNNVIGSIIRPSGGSVLGNAAAGGNHMIRTTNMLKFNSDKFSGFGVNLAYIQNNANSTQTKTNTGTGAAGSAGTGGNNNMAGWNAGLDYRFKAFNAVVAYGTVKQTQNASLADQLPTYPSTIALGVNPNTQTNNMYAGAMYNFGILTGYLAYTNAKIQDNFNSSNYIKRQGQQLGVRGNFTPKIESWASIGNGKLTYADGPTSSASNLNAWQLGTSYILSKRTNLYAIYGQSTTAISTAVPRGAAGSQYAMGVRHTF
jgi:predicted porin